MTNFFELLQKYNPLSQPASMTDIAFDTGVIAERERIIKILEDLDRHGTTHSEFCSARHAYAAKAIDRIKEGH